MRGDLELQVRIIGRPEGRVGLVTVVAALTGVAALYFPWYAVRAEVTMLGTTRGRTLAVMPGWQAQPWIWLIGALALAAAAIGGAVALDRAPRRPHVLVVLCALGAMALTAVSAVLPPARERFSDPRLRDLHSMADRIPEDVDLVLGVGVDVGIWLALGAGLLLLASALALRRT